jgi:RsiW-degrading membrane proteinase PrsW (M82 family)
VSSVLLISLTAAVVPTLIYLYLIWWSDRYEREPAWLLLTMFLWGAVPAVLLAVLAALIIQRPLANLVSGASGDLIQTVLVAPTVEEFVKGMAVLAVVLFFAGEVDSILDGVIYGALVGIGFALTENFLYFLQSAMADSRLQFLMLTALRGVVFGLNHAWYTALVGAAAALAFLRYKGMERWLVLLTGLLVAMFAHALHNLSSLEATRFTPFVVVSVLLNWGGLALIVVIIVLSWRRERECIVQYLADEVPGVLSPEGYHLAQTTSPRWAAWLGRLHGRSMRTARLEADLRHTATELAFSKRRLASTPARPGLDREVAQLRQRLYKLDQNWTRAAL